ncbi:hypothetical protein GS531_19490 [Rhodococcus hoagii]|nr:hypothetical protein [Prescottella equi]
MMPIYRPPLDITRLFGETRLGESDGKAVGALLTPHSKWSIHSSTDNC